MKKYLNLFFFASAFALASCSDDEMIDPESQIPDDQKERVSFTMSDEGGAMFAKRNGTRAGFTSATHIVARYESFKSETIGGTLTTEKRTTKTQLSAAAEATTNTYSVVSYPNDADIRYWDDAFGRKGNISVYAVAVPQKGNDLKNNSKSLYDLINYAGENASTSNTIWKKDGSTDDKKSNNHINWTVTNGTDIPQSATTLADEDLCYSNNIQADATLGKNGRYVYGTYDSSTANNGGYPSFSYDGGATNQYPHFDDGYLRFKQNTSATDPGKFDKGHLIFKHALTRITIDLKGGEGFDYTNPSSFTLESQETGQPASVDLLKMYTTGTFDIQSGSWLDKSTTDNTYMSAGTKASGTSFGKDKIIYSLSAQVLPGYEINDGVIDNNMLSFQIDGNCYYVTKDQVFDALKAGDLSTASGKITLEQGKNYHLTITVNKKSIDVITATLIDWVDINGAFAAKNTYITFNSLIPSDNKTDCQHFDIYRVENLSKTITDPSHTTFDNGDNTLQYKTGWSDATSDKVSTEGTPASVTKNEDTTPTNDWKTTWFFETNKSFYHFRTVNPGVTIAKDVTYGDYFTMYSGPVKDWSEADGADNTISSSLADGYVNDYHWGAVYDSNASNLNYNTSTGFESQLAGPVGPTTSTINLVEQHMMSNIKVVLLTPSKKDAQDNYVLADGAVTLIDENNVSTVNVTNYAGSATVRMGTGLIESTTNWTASSTLTQPTFNGENPYIVKKDFQFATGEQTYWKTMEHTYRVVPQPLKVTAGDLAVENKVGLTIQTPDNNVYYVVEDLSQIKVSSVTGSALKDDYKGYNTGDGMVIDRWLPGYTYTYYFILTKTGIEAITCTIVDWVNVEASGFEIDLES